MARKVFLYVFTFIGILSTIFFLMKFFKESSRANHYHKHCKEIREGMSLETARLVMGDNDPGVHVGTVEISKESNSAPEYYLHYPAGAGASSGSVIYFDARTLTVTKVYCSD